MSLQLTGSVDDDEVYATGIRMLFHAARGLSCDIASSVRSCLRVDLPSSYSSQRVCQLFNILHTSARYRKSPAVMLTAVAHVCPRRPSGHADRRHRVLLILLQVPRVKAREAHGPCPNTVLGEVGQSMQSCTINTYFFVVF